MNVRVAWVKSATETERTTGWTETFKGVPSATKIFKRQIQMKGRSFSIGLSLFKYGLGYKTPLAKYLDKKKSWGVYSVSVADFTHATLTNIAHYYKLPRKTAAKQYEVAKETDNASN